MDRLLPELRGGYAHDFRLADEAFHAGQLEATSNKRKMHWQNWCAYIKHLDVDLYLQQVPYPTRVQCLTGFAARTQTGFYGQRRQVQSSTVTGAITAIGQTIALACNKNPTKVIGSKKFLPALQIMIDSYTKADPPTQKKLLVEADVPELLIKLGYGENTVKQKPKKQTVQFKMEGVTFFKMDKRGILWCLPRNAPDSLRQRKVQL
jgi:hypothetical protein